ncbi:MAG: ribulose bisphosphate carboxylase small subunit [Granulosicoccaceae bacterium]|jgi:ribulose-bisphosphate carboxylase small chain
MSLTNEMGNYSTAQTLETFGFLPKMDQNEIQAQIAYILANGWTPAIEHEHPSRATDHYWTMWKLPFFGETNMANVINELEACHRDFPDHHVRLIGYDNYTQGQGSCFVVFEGRM